jgi:hypothetical protein
LRNPGWPEAGCVIADGLCKDRTLPGGPDGDSMKQVTSHEGQHCANCGIAMQGEFCHECGQSIHSVLKPIHGLLEDTLDIVLHVDHRVVHTVPPLLLKPGFLTLEYFSGRRVRYIAPFRLMFVLSLLAFFVIHLQIDRASGKWPLDSMGLNGQLPEVTMGDELRDAQTPAEVRAALKEKLADLDEARKTRGLPQVARAEIDVAAQKVRAQANQRLTALGATPISAAPLAYPAAAAKPEPSETNPAGLASDALSKSPDEKMTPVHLAWLPNMVNARLTLLGQHMVANWHTFKHGNAATREVSRQRLISGFFGVLPPTLFVLIPIFALLLKIFYVFKRRLYVEHLIVALHSHAFLFLNLLLGALVTMLATWVKPYAEWLALPLDWIGAVLWLWIPVYLLIMQKRVYRQGWPMTVLKYLTIGWCYGWLLLFALMIAFALGLAQ